MRALSLIAMLVVSAAAQANPMVVPPPLKAYLDFERVIVSITATDATFAATFRFRSDEGPAQWWNGEPRPAFVALPIWFPEVGSDPAVERFWRTFRKGGVNVVTTNAAAGEVFDDAVRLRVRIGGQQLSMSNGIGQFWAVLAYREMVYGDAQTTDEDLHRTLERLFRDVQNGRQAKPEPDEHVPDEHGFYCLFLSFGGSTPFVQEQTPVVVSYRQPLARVNGEGRFFYLPIFDNLPKRASTTDTNEYSITLVAEGCEVVVSDGTEESKLEGGQRLTVAPKHLQPIRARVPSEPNPQDGANGKHG